MDHFTRCIALEEADRPNGAKVCSLAPGVIDTDMQVQLRSTDASQFPDKGRFTGLKDTGGAAFQPFTMTFTTGGDVQNPTDPQIAFERVALASPTGQQYSAVPIGPAGHL